MCYLHSTAGRQNAQTACWEGGAASPPLGPFLAAARARGLGLPALTLPVLAGLRKALLRGAAWGLHPREASALLAARTGQPPLHCDLAWGQVEKAEPDLARALGERRAGLPGGRLSEPRCEAAAAAMEQAWGEYWGGIHHMVMLRKGRKGRKQGPPKQSLRGGGGGKGSRRQQRGPPTPPRELFLPPERLGAAL